MILLIISIIFYSFFVISTIISFYKLFSIRKSLKDILILNEKILEKCPVNNTPDFKNCKNCNECKIKF